VKLSGRALAVEFLGLPGVGKSAVARRTAEVLSQRGFVVRGRVDVLSDRSALVPRLRGYTGKSLLIARELLAHPRQSWRAIRAIAATSQPSARVLLMVVANWLMQSSLLRSCRTTPAVNLLEEGIFQGLWTIGLEARPGTVRTLGAAFPDALSMPDVVVVVEADLEAVVQRLQGRNGRESRADRWSRDDGRAFAHASSLMLEVLDALNTVDEGGQRSRVIRVDNRSVADTDVAARQVALRIEQLCASELPPAHLRAGERTTA
jgi:thymidylate kinase